MTVRKSVQVLILVMTLGFTAMAGWAQDNEGDIEGAGHARRKSAPAQENAGPAQSNAPSESNAPAQGNAAPQGNAPEATAAAPSKAPAQNKAARGVGYRLFLMGGGASMGNIQNFSELFVPFSSAYATGAKGIVGVEAPLMHSNIFGIEGSLGYGQNNLKLTNNNTTPATTRSYGLRTMRISADLVAHSPSAFWGLYPYGVAGLEFDEFNPTSAAQSLATSIGFGFEPTAKFSSQSAIGYNFGGGLDWKATSNFDVRIDVRDHITTSPTFGLPTAQPSTAGLAWFPVTGSAKNLEYCIGFVYHFGGK